MWIMKANIIHTVKFTSLLEGIEVRLRACLISALDGNEFSVLYFGGLYLE
jgi:hypothetical protein